MEKNTKESTLLQEDSPASLTRSQVKDLLQKIHEIYGEKCIGSFAKLSPNGSWLKTSQGFSQVSLVGISEEFCETWPKRGIVCNGFAFQLQRLELGTWHKRERIWIVANSYGIGRDRWHKEQGSHDSEDGTGYAHKPTGSSSSSRTIPNAYSQRLQAQRFASRLQQKLTEFRSDSEPRESKTWSAEPRVGRVVNGLSNRAHRIKGLGNAVVPQIPYLIGKAILETIT